MIETALGYHRLGLSPIPLYARSKKPALDGWKPFQSQRPDEHQIREWFGSEDRNIGIVCGADKAWTIAQAAPTPAEVANFNNLHIIALAKLCRELQKMQGDRPFYLDARKTDARGCTSRTVGDERGNRPATPAARIDNR